MSGLYIPGASLPENCFKCPAHEWYDFGGKNHGYQCPLLRTTEAISNCEARSKRRDNCPLVPVPQHGDLIDRTRIVYGNWGDLRLALKDMIERMPAIIPADGETP